MVFKIVVVCAMVICLDVYRREQSTSNKLYLIACVFAQFLTLCGLYTDNKALICIGHVCFTSAMWSGCLLTTGDTLFVVLIALIFTLISRRLLGYCLFSHSRHSSATNCRVFDALYAIPLLISTGRLLVDCSLGLH